MTPLLFLLALPATLLATVEAVGFFRGIGPVPMPLPILPFVHPFPLVHRMTFPMMPMPPPMPIQRPRTTRTRSTTRNEVRSVPVMAPFNDRQGDVIVVINDRDCFSGVCRDRGMGRAAGFMDGMDLMGRGGFPMNDLGLGGRGPYNIHDADHVVINGNGRY